MRTAQAKCAGHMSIGALSNRTGFSIDTIRYYERLGLLPEVGRTTGSHRCYGDEHLRRLRFLQRGRRLGLPLKRLRELVEGRAVSCEKLRSVLAQREREVREGIAELKAIDRELRLLLEACRSSSPAACSVLESLLVDDDERETPPCCSRQ
jgi:MerR family mercuric resistance operon transcriptional regulator